MLITHGLPSMSDDRKLPVSRYTLGQRLFLFLGAMDLAITLLLTLAVASVIGTVLQQNQPYTDYIMKFGPFWFELFESAGLYDVYSAVWFLSILTLLVISTSVCVIRNTPSMLRDMWSLRTHIQEKSLRAMHHSQQWNSASSVEKSIENIETELSQQGFRLKRIEKGEGKTIIAAMRGGMNRLGYIFTHMAIIVICLGALVDSNLPLKFAEWQGNIKIETRDIPVSEIPLESRLPAGNHAFRASVNIPEGRTSNVAFLGMRDGYLVQELPFTIEVKDFRIEHYATGQPKSFETDLLIHDDDLAAPLASTIAVNHPLFYKGYAIYQASFSDGGTGLTIDIYPLEKQAGSDVITFDTKVFENRQMHWGDKSLRLEINAFRAFNINPDPTDDDPDNLRNFGPSISFKLRTDAGEAREFFNYMLPIPRNGREYFLSGVRNSPAEEFGYLYLPLDAESGLTAFSHFRTQLHNEELVDAVAHDIMKETLSAVDDVDEQLENSLQGSLVGLINMFVDGGFDEVSRFVETSIPDDERDTLGSAYLSMLHEMLARIYFDELSDSLAGYDNERQLVFLQDAVDAMGTFSRYGSPVFLSLTDYDHVEASGLQIARFPGKSTVYFGCALLIAGVFLLFYLPQRRLWLLVSARGGQTTVLLSGMSNRNPREFDLFFSQIANKLEQKSGNSSAI